MSALLKMLVIAEIHDNPQSDHKIMTLAIKKKIKIIIA